MDSLLKHCSWILGGYGFTGSFNPPMLTRGTINKMGNLPALQQSQSKWPRPAWQTHHVQTLAGEKKFKKKLPLCFAFRHSSTHRTTQPPRPPPPPPLSVSCSVWLEKHLTRPWLEREAKADEDFAQAVSGNGTRRRETRPRDRERERESDGRFYNSSFIMLTTATVLSAGLSPVYICWVNSPGRGETSIRGSGRTLIGLCRTKNTNSCCWHQPPQLDVIYSTRY